MCASTYTLSFNSLPNIVNATQPPDLLSLGIHRLREGGLTAWDVQLLICEFPCLFDATAAAKAKRTKQSKWCCGGKSSRICCFILSWRIKPILVTQWIEMHSLWHVHLGLVCMLVPWSSEDGSLREDSTGGDGSNNRRQSICGRSTYNWNSSFRVIKADRKPWWKHELKESLKQTFASAKNCKLHLHINFLKKTTTY